MAKISQVTPLQVDIVSDVVCPCRPRRVICSFPGAVSSGECLLCASRGLIPHWCTFFVHRYPFWKDFPCGFGADENMQTDLNLWVSVHASQGDPVDFPLVYTT